MRERAQLSFKKTTIGKGTFDSKAGYAELLSAKSTPFCQVSILQQTAGNQTVQRLFDGGIIQTKLKIGKFGDKYELEADRLAEQVMSMPDLYRPIYRKEGDIQRQVNDEERRKEEEELIQPKSLTSKTATLVQRQVDEEERKKEEEKLIQPKPISGPITPLVQIQVEDTEKKKREEEMFQAKEENGSLTANADVESSINSLKGGGSTLSEATRNYFEPRFGYDFSGVRVHTGGAANEAVRSINARAFTIGNDVVFGSGNYSPETKSGKNLLAHELTHVVQQDSAKAGNSGYAKKISTSFEPRIFRWKIEGDVATSDRDRDTLWGLSKIISGDGTKWTHIKKVKMQSPKADSPEYWRYLWIGDKFDISELKRLLRDFSPWRRQGVLSILCDDPIGRGTVDIMSAYPVYRFKSRTRKRQYYEDPAKTIKKGTPKTIETRGYFDLSGKEISVKAGFTNATAASVLVHESTHAKQYKDYEERKRIFDLAAWEYEAHIRQELFNIQNKIPPKDPSFRMKIGSIELVNIFAIINWVNKVYGIEKIFTDYDVEEKGKSGPIGPWKCHT